MKPYAEIIDRAVESRREDYCRMSDTIWDYAETAFQEHRSSVLQQEYLKNCGFTVKTGLAGMDTAFCAGFRQGAGGSTIAFLGEFDALPRLSQRENSLVEEPITPGGAGHGCGHNGLGTGCLAAAVALKEYMQHSGLEGEVRYYGCPAEEGGGGKAFMVRDHVFDGVDVALSWHGLCGPSVAGGSWSLSTYQIKYTFTGRAAHAGGSPHLGRSALDAAELMNVGVQFLREHMPPKTQIHYAFLDSGGPAANVVHPRAVLSYIIRAPRITELPELFERVNKIARGAAMMTETEVDILVCSDCADVVPNNTVTGVLQENSEAFFPIKRSAEELEYAKTFSALATPQAVAFQRERAAKVYDGEDKSELDAPVFSFLANSNEGFGICSDIGDVSYIVPLSYIMVTTTPVGVPNHTWKTVTVGKSPIMHSAVLTAAKCLASAGADLMLDPGKVDRAKAELQRRTADGGYPYPLSPDLKPQIEP